MSIDMKCFHWIWGASSETRNEKPNFPPDFWKNERKIFVTFTSLLSVMLFLIGGSFWKENQGLSNDRASSVESFFLTTA